MRWVLAALALAISAPVTAAAYPSKLVERGRYLATAADCVACHTAKGGSEYAGGYVIQSPIGSIIATNITPSRTHGIGVYTEAQFADALRKGLRSDGAHLYPAMPYTAYARLTDADTHALYAYFMTGVAPVDVSPPPTRLPFPFNQRFAMAGWNALFLDDRQFAPDPARAPAWNRGAYLVEALGHCSDCHSPRGALMQVSPAKAFAGSPVGPWYAPNITPDPVAGIGAWRPEEIIAYLKTGRSDGRAYAAGGMAEVVEHSTSKLDDADLAAMATYLRSVPPVAGEHTRVATRQAAPTAIEAGLRGTATKDDGAALYSGLCASCHGSTGAGTRDQAYPALFHDSSVYGPGPDNLVAVILNGVDRRVGSQHTLMPDFGPDSYVQPLTDTQVAALATFVRLRFGPGGTVSAGDVATTRAGGSSSPLLFVTRAAMTVAAILLLVAVGVWLRWRRA